MKNWTDIEYKRRVNIQNVLDPRYAGSFHIDLMASAHVWREATVCGRNYLACVKMSFLSTFY